MRSLPHTRKFRNRILAVSGPVASSMWRGRSPELIKRLMKTLLGEPQTPSLPIQMSKAESFVSKVCRGFLEIDACIERLKDFETYIGRFPFSRTRVTRDSYLQFIVESHLGEIYLLRERLVSYSQTIARLYRQDPIGPHVKEMSNLLVEWILEDFESFSNVRGDHVHKERYLHEDIMRLRLVSLLRRGDLIPVPPLLQRIAVKESHQKLKEQSKKWNRRIAKILNLYFKKLTPILFKGEELLLRYPS